MINQKKIRENFYRQLEGFGGIEILIETIPDLIFWVKDTSGVFVMGNQAAAKKAGMHDFKEVIGKTDFDLYPINIAQKFRNDDLKVIESKKVIKNKLEPHIVDFGGFALHSTTKIPLFSKTGRVVGVGGVSRKIENSPVDFSQYNELCNSMKYISKNYSQSISVNKLAEIDSLSVISYRRIFKKKIGVNPFTYLLNIRLKGALHLLANDNNTLSMIANKTGFYSNAHMCKLIKKKLGMTSTDFKKKYSKLEQSSK